jgi:hypothetical protein
MATSGGGDAASTAGQETGATFSMSIHPERIGNVQTEGNIT